jgi:hypothetical protein
MKKHIPFFVGLAITACGGLGDVEDRPALAVIEGQLSTLASTTIDPAPANMRVAIVWTSNTGFRAAADVAVAPVFPSKYRLEIAAPPPVEAMSVDDQRQPDPTTDNPGTAGSAPDPVTPGLEQQTRPTDAKSGPSSFAIGSIVAYEDRNGNNQLDLVEGGTSIDRVLGTNKDLVVVWLEGELPPMAAFQGKSMPVKGYNLLKVGVCNARRGQEPAEPCTPSEWLPIATAYDMTLTADPELSELACRDGSSSVSAGATKRIAAPETPGPNGWPAKDDPHLVCSQDGTTYSIFECTKGSLGLCRGTYERCDETVFRLPSATPPAEWPCTK